MNARRHDLVIGPFARGGAQQTGIPLERRGNPAAIEERDNKLARREFNGARFKFSDVKFQSTHSRHSDKILEQQAIIASK